MASAGLVHPKTKSSAALPAASLVDEQALEVRDGKSIGGFVKHTAFASGTKIDPTLLSLEQNLIQDYCNRETVQAFKKVCNGLGKPAVYESKSIRLLPFGEPRDRRLPVRFRYSLQGPERRRRRGRHHVRRQEQRQEMRVLHQLAPP